MMCHPTTAQPTPFIAVDHCPRQVGTRGAGVVVSVFKFGGKSKTSFKFTGTPGAAGDAVDASKVIFWPQAATKCVGSYVGPFGCICLMKSKGLIVNMVLHFGRVAQGGQRGLAGFVQRGNIAFNGAKVNALELSGPNAGRAVTAIRTALTTGGSGKAVRMLPPQWKKKNKASYASVDVTVAGVRLRFFVFLYQCPCRVFWCQLLRDRLPRVMMMCNSALQNNVVVTFQNSDGQAGTMTFTGA